MIINKKTIEAERHRAQWSKPVLSCVSNGISITKQAAKLINAPCKISFEKIEGKFVLFIDEQNGIEVKRDKDCKLHLRDTLKGIKENNRGYFQTETHPV